MLNSIIQTAFKGYTVILICLLVGLATVQTAAGENQGNGATPPGGVPDWLEVPAFDLDGVMLMRGDGPKGPPPGSA